ncbi:hypothetical protein GCM10008986_14340 [Salinibacillus aidingensis]|uniref:Lipoprotein n=1 Tax=Salinibacillus aidingensis TaxID=237684 RepID=A0ABN1B3P3_9BACI
MKKRSGKFFVTMFFALLVLYIAGCSEDTEKTKTQDENIQTIEAVLENTFTGPDDELKQIWESDVEEKMKAIGPYTEKLFKDYFTENAYLEYAGVYGMTFLLEAHHSDYRLELKKATYEKTKSEEDIYDFTVQVEYQKDGSEQSEVGHLKGQANLNVDHKIEEMIIRNAGDFLEIF